MKKKRRGQNFISSTRARKQVHESALTNKIKSSPSTENRFADFIAVLPLHGMSQRLAKQDGAKSG
jgi:hypothetical protein